MARRASPPRSGSKPGAPITGTNKLRIIGGRWRSRKLEFASLPGLRPTTDRVRETLFNWLQRQVPGAHCLDLFAGSGALGLEALSRGAARVTLVDSAAAVVQQLRQNLGLLGAEQDASVVHSQAIRWLQSASCEQTFDLVFLDPPFEQGMLAGCCEALEQQALLSPQSWIYIEAEKTLQPLPVPAHWRLERSLNAGQVSCYLYQRVVEE
ncbi:MAG: 16S rRNA (guanine966-N2)-methyltransferase [Motiliproteus sp.]|jgi:16S rRNA (guanine966-N2)-methyltransferase